MNRLQEIEERLSVIQEDLDKEDSNLDELETEIEGLKEERKSIKDKAEKRKKLMDDVVNNRSVQVLQKFEEPGGKEMEQEKRFTPETKEYRQAYLNNLRGMATVEERAAVSAQSVIPTQTLNLIIEKLEQTSVIYSRITDMQIPSNVTIPIENAKNDASWVAMGTASSDSADSFGEVTLTAHKLIKTIEIDADVMAMSIDAFENFIAMGLAKKLSKAVENAILNGTGVNQPTGLFLEGEITQTADYTAAGMTYDDLLAIMAELPTPYHPNAVFVTTREVFFQQIHGIKDTDDKPIVKQEGETGARYTVFGYPVIINDYVPADTLLFGDLEYYYFNWVKPITIDRDDSVGFRTGSSVFRGMGLADGKKALAEAFVVSEETAV